MRKNGIRCVAVAVCLLGAFLRADGQTDVNLSHRYLGRLLYNPSVAGEDSASVAINAFFREQWIGFDRAPSTQLITVDNLFNRYNSGVGVVFVKDEIGFSKTINCKASYSYHVRLTRDSYLAMGLAAGIIHNSSDESNFNPEDPNDPDITYMIEKETIADFDLGFDYRWRELNIGFAVSHITKGNRNSKITPHWYMYVNYDMNVTENWRITPTVFAAINEKSRVYEPGFRAEYRNRLNVGMAYRISENFYSDAVVGLLGIILNDYVRLNYSYDFTVGRSSSDVTGAHELMLAFRIRKDRPIFWK